MENYKVKAGSEAKSKEAQELFVALGGEVRLDDRVGIVCLTEGKIYTDDIKFYDAYGDCKELTIPQLKDMVVLKRNDVGDANAYCNDNSEHYYISSDGKYFYYLDGYESSKWMHSSNHISYLEKHVKPIEKPMKEFLDPANDYKFIVTDKPFFDWIEVPEGAESFNYFDNKDNLFFLMGSGEGAMFSNELNDWDWKTWGDIDFDGVICLWQRETQPEALPFIDDEPKYDPKETLNDKVASAEVARQEAFDTQISGDHYKLLPIQPMKFALANGLDYAQGNVIKYVIRHASKNGKDDLLKAIHNIELMIEHYYG